MLRATEGSFSQVAAAFEAISAIFGIVRFRLAVGEIERKIPPVVAVAVGAVAIIAASICSQQPVSASLSGSVAMPTKVKGVEIGME